MVIENVHNEMLLSLYQAVTAKAEGMEYRDVGHCIISPLNMVLDMDE